MAAILRASSFRRLARKRRPPIFGFVLAFGISALLLAQAATACLLADRLRVVAPHLTEEEILLLAHGTMKREVIPYSLEEAVACQGGMADIFPCSNVDLEAFLALADIGGGSGNDLWGWKDPMTNVEYALIGRSNGLAFVDLSQPDKPVFVGDLPTHTGNSSWRDVKVYQNHAFVVSDNNGNHGMQVFDLTQLRTVSAPPVVFGETAHFNGPAGTQIGSAHNIVINEDTGFAYVVGSNSCSGGLYMVNIRDPVNPSFAGCYSDDGYTHDAQCVTYQGPDVTYQGREICFNSNEDTLTIVDVTDKATPIQLARAPYDDSGYTHQGWLTEDHRYFVHDDELDEFSNGHTTRTYTWNISDLDVPVVAGFWDAAGASVDHNQYIKGQHTYQANYTRGLRILELLDPDNGSFKEVAFFDTFPSGDGNGFSGAWSTYPFFDNGLVLVSDISRGLFILRTNLALDIFQDGFEAGNTSAWILMAAGFLSPSQVPGPAPAPYFDLMASLQALP